jgi:hypothetical protein
MKGLEDKAFSQVNNLSDQAFDYSIFKFPINNSDGSLMNNGNSYESLDHLYFLEFDINNCGIPKDHLKIFKEVNNDFVEQEIHFVLNVILKKINL